MALYLRDLRAELLKSGEADFRRSYHDPILLVIGRIAELDESNSDGTIMTSPGDMAEQIALLHRVFVVRRKDNAVLGPITLGRVSESDVTIPEYSISKRHCVFTRQSGTLQIADCGSSNGTLVNGERLAPNKPKTLKGGELLGLGRFSFMIQLPKKLPEFVLQWGR